MENRRFFGLHRNIFFAGLVSLFMDISSEMVYPLVPLFLTNVLGSTKATVGVIEGIAESTASLLKVFSGWISDLFGKRKMLMTIGYGVSTLSRPVLYGAGSWAEVLYARFIDRFGKGVRTSPRDALIAESADRGTLGRAFGFHRAMDTVGAVIGPALAALLLAVFLGNLRLVFLFSAVPGIIAVILILVFIKEKERKSRVEKRPPSLNFTSMENGPLRRYILTIVVFSLGNTSDAFIILRAQGLGMPLEVIPLVYLSSNAVYAATAAPLGRLSDRVGLKNMVLTGFLFYSAIYGGFAFASDQTHLWGLFLLYGLFKGMSDGPQRAYLARLSTEERMGTAYGIFHSSMGLALLPASVMAGMLWDRFGAASAFLYGSILSLIAAVIFALPVKEGRR